MQAAEQLGEAIESQPEFYEAYYMLGQLHAREKRPDPAREHLQVFESKKAAVEARSTIWRDFAAQTRQE